MSARLADNTPVLSSPEIMQWLLNQALSANPTSTLVPSGGSMAESLSVEIKTLEGMMGNKTSEYWKGPKAEDNQARYRKLIDARDKLPK